MPTGDYPMDLRPSVPVVYPCDEKIEKDLEDLKWELKKLKVRIAFLEADAEYPV